LQLVMLGSQRSARTATPLRVSFDKEMRGFFAKAIPGMIASSGPQWLMVAGAIIASATPSAVSWLYFANRLIELPLGIVGVAMGTVLVPELTRAIASGDRGAVAHTQSRALELAAGLALPATFGLIVLAEPIVRLLFEHGAFAASDSAATAWALTWLALGLPAHVLIKALSPAFYARGDTMTPLLATAKGLVVAGALALVLGHIYGVAGIAAAIAAGAWSGALSLLRDGAAEFGFSVDADARRRLPRIMGAALAMGALLWLTADLAPGSHNSAGSGLVQFAVLALQIAAGILVYGLLVQALGVTSWREAKTALKRPAARDQRA
jgi:putative peptidoglycan lipid II flippase